MSLELERTHSQPLPRKMAEHEEMKAQAMAGREAELKAQEEVESHGEDEF